VGEGWEPLKELYLRWPTTSLIRPEWNDLGMWVQEGRLRFYLNGQLLDATVIARAPVGQVGVVMESPPNEFEVWFDDFLVLKPK